VQDGRELPISPHQEGRLTLLQINDAKDGEIVLEYRDTTLENVLFALGLLVLLAALAGAVLRPRPLPSPFGDRALTTIHRLLAVVIGVVALLVVVAIGIASSESVDREWLSGEPGGAKVGAVLHRNAPQALSIRPRHHCVAALTRDPRWGCSEGDLEPQLIPAPRREGRIPSCLAVGIPPKGASDIRFALPAGTARLKGRLHLLDGNGVTASADLAPGGRSQKLALSSRGGKGFALSVGNGAESVAFRFKSKHKHAAQVCLEAVALSGGAR